MESDIVTSECLLASTTELDSAVREFSADVELPAIKGLGALFKITEIFLTDEAAVDRLEEYSAFTQEQMPNIDLDLMKSPIRSPPKVESSNEEFAASVEDMVLVNQMVPLGPPTSFGTSNEERDESSCEEICLSSEVSLEESLATIDRLYALSQEFGTHIWLCNEWNIGDKCSLQGITAEVHAQEIENCNESMVAASEDASTVDELSDGDTMHHREQKNEKRLRLQRQSSSDEDGQFLFPASEPLKKLLLPGMMEELSISIIKYWCQRYQLFSRFDKGVKLDEEGWFSVTPEVLAKHHAARSRTGTVIDCFTGVGGNAIQFAQMCHHVIAIDINPRKIEYAHHNARIYEVADCIDFIVGDFFQIAPSLKGDVVFLSPPWGGPDYAKFPKYDIRDMLKPKDGFSLFKAAQRIAPNIIMFLPRNVDLNQLAELSWLSCPPLALEVEKNYINGKLKAITAYYGDISILSNE